MATQTGATPLSSLLGLGGGLWNADKSPLEQRKERYYLALGKFISAFASAEVATHFLLVDLLRVSPWKIKAITGGLKVSTMLTLLARVAPKAIKNAKKKKEFDKLIQHLDQIATFRNALIHRTVDLSSDDLLAHDFPTAKSTEVAKELRFQITHLEDATVDLHCLTARLHAVKGWKLRVSREVRKMMFAPWRYKPLAQEKMWNRLLADALRSRPPSAPSHP
jgi:hypothetical protein